MLCAILYLKNLDKDMFSYLKKRIKNDYVLNKVEYPNTVTAVKSLLLNYQPNYNSSRKSQYQVAGSQQMFPQRGKTWDGEGE